MYYCRLAQCCSTCTGRAGYSGKLEEGGLLVYLKAFVCGSQLLQEATEEETSLHNQITPTVVRPPRQVLPQPATPPEHEMVTDCCPCVPKCPSVQMQWSGPLKFTSTIRVMLYSYCSGMLHVTQ